MSVILIVAMAKNRTIGKDGKIPWHLSRELKLFKQITTGHTLIMGRKTYESIGRPLPERKNIVVTRNPDFKADGCHVYTDLNKAISDHKNERIFVIGGAEIFKQCMDLADEIHLTVVQKEFDGDVSFPEFNADDYRISERTYYEDDPPFELIHYIKK